MTTLLVTENTQTCAAQRSLTLICNLLGTGTTTFPALPAPLNSVICLRAGNLPTSGAGFVSGSSPSGVAQVESVPYPNIVIQVYYDGVLVQSTTSDASGLWELNQLDTSKQYDVIAAYPTYNKLIYAGVTPGVKTLTLTGSATPTIIRNRANTLFYTITGGSGIYSNARITAGTLPASLSLELSSQLTSGVLTIDGLGPGTGSSSFTIAVDSSDGQTATLAITPTYKNFYDDLMGVAGTIGMVFDFGNLALMFQDTAATVPVTAVGQTVKAIQCAATSAILTNATGNTLAQDPSGRYYLQMSGNPYSNLSGFPAGMVGSPLAAFTIAASLAPVSEANGLMLLAGPNAGANVAGAEIYLANTSFGNGTNSVASTASAGQHMIVGTKSGSTYTTYSSGNVLATNNTATSPTLANPGIYVGSDAALAQTFSGPMWWLVVINRAMTSQEIATMSSYV